MDHEEIEIILALADRFASARGRYEVWLIMSGDPKCDDRTLRRVKAWRRECTTARDLLALALHKQREPPDMLRRPLEERESSVLS